MDGQHSQPTSKVRSTAFLACALSVSGWCQHLDLLSLSSTGGERLRLLGLLFAAHDLWMTLAPIPVLRSHRLTLRALCQADTASLVTIAHDAEVTRYLHEGPAPSAEDVSNRVAGALLQWEQRGYGMMGVEDNQGFVGRLGLFHPVGVEEPLLVYVFDRRGWGKGYATEGVGLFLSWLRTAHELQHVLCHIDPSNTASAHVAARFGAMRTGTTLRIGNELDVWNLPINAQKEGY